MRRGYVLTNESLKRNAIVAFVLAIPSQAISICLSLGLIIVQRKLTRSSLGLLLLLGCAFIASVNSTRVIEADLYNYSQRSLDLAELNALQAIEYSVEIVYHFSNWVLVRLLGLDFLDFFLLVNFITYFLAVKAIENCPSPQQKTISLLYRLACGMLLLTSPVLFEQSSQLVRQYLAMGLGVFGMSRMLSGRRGWLWIGLALFTHVSSAVYMLAWVPVISQKCNNLFYRLVVQIIFISIIIISTPLIISMLSEVTGIGYFTYGQARLGQEVFHQLNPLGFSGKAVVWIHLVLALLVAFKSGKSIEMDKFTSVALAFIVIDLAIIISDIFNLHEISVRMAQFAYFTLPLLFLMSYHVSRWMGYLCGLLVLFQVLGFGLRGLHWKYTFGLENMILPAYLEFFI